MSESAGSKRYLIGGGAAACAVCCAPPVLGLLGVAGVGVVGTAATLAFAGVVFALVAAAASVLAFILRKRNQEQEFALKGSSHDSHPLPDPVRRGGRS